MAILNVTLDTVDVGKYRKRLRAAGFLSANYFSTNGFDLQEMRRLALAGKMDARRCVIGKSVRWYYCEDQAELAHIRGQL